MFRTPYNNRPPKVSVPSDTTQFTRQEFKDECDINRIMKRYVKTGVLPPSVGVGLYGDFSDVGDYQAAQATLERAHAQFAAMPSEVRDRFRNDPGVFVDFVSNKDNFDEAVKLGLLSDEAAKRKAVVVTPSAEVPPPVK